MTTDQSAVFEESETSTQEPDPESSALPQGLEGLEPALKNARDQIERANQITVRFVQENPALALGAAVGIGYIVGRLAARRWLI